MKKWIVLLGLCAASSINLQGATLIQDDFNDGVRDRSLWRTGSNGAKFSEHAGHLYAHSGLTFPGDEPRLAVWELKTPITLYPGNTLEIEATIRFPKMSLPSASYAGFFISLTDGSRGNPSGMSIICSETNRLMTGSVSGEGVTPRSLSGGNNRFQVKLQYRMATGLARFYLRLPDGTWSKLGTKNLNTLWGISPGDNVTMIPAIQFASAKCWIKPGANIYVDDYQLRVH